MKNVVLKKSFRGLEEGTEFAYDPKLDAWVYEKNEEEISDHGMSTSRQRVQFSDTFVQKNEEIFDVPVNEIKRQRKIDELKALLREKQDELNKLENG